MQRTEDGHRSRKIGFRVPEISDTRRLIIKKERKKKEETLVKIRGDGADC